ALSGPATGGGALARHRPCGTATSASFLRGQPRRSSDRLRGWQVESGLRSARCAPRLSKRFRGTWAGLFRRIQSGCRTEKSPATPQTAKSPAGEPDSRVSPFLALCGQDVRSNTEKPINLDYRLMGFKEKRAMETAAGAC